MTLLKATPASEQAGLEHAVALGGVYTSTLPFCLWQMLLIAHPASTPFFIAERAPVLFGTPVFPTAFLLFLSGQRGQRDARGHGGIP